MKTRSWVLLPWLVLATLDAGAQTKDLSPPPLNPHPKEALHITVSFDRPKDADRYVVVMTAHYWNQQSECGYVEANWNRRFIHPEGDFEIPNHSRDPREARFAVYLDRYNRETCNWELASPSFVVRDTYTGMERSGDWGLREDLAPGAEYKAICPFRPSKYSKGCFGRHPVPDSPWYNEIPEANRIPVTVRVSKDSVRLRPRAPGFFDNFVKPVPNQPSLLPSSNGTQ